MKEAIRFCGAPVDFEEIGVNRESSEDELENAILAVSRNGVGLKGRLNVPCKIACVSCVYNNVAYYALNIMLCNAAFNPKKCRVDAYGDLKHILVQSIGSTLL